MVTGRPTMPFEYKVAKGTPDRKPRTARVSKGETVEELPKPPKHLGKSGRRMWRQIGTFAIDMGTLTASCFPALALLAGLYDQLDQHRATIKRDGQFYTMNNGAISPHPALRLLVDAENAYTAS